MDRSGGSLGTLRLWLRLEGQAMYPEVSARDTGSARDPKVMEEPGGSPWILRSYWRPGGPYSRSWDRDRSPEAAFEAVLEPGGLDPEIAVWNPEVL
ncbi:hypothetical protein DY000_02007696 [Brassica cretica]|uniref:Uncharacterized protein n=1 Tax=Brassica cretica TaxID=69181 RepID=A0ABQ7C0S1_BRACR|nr:hypothetical protein DY000_02007696 [Brassica cretica]